MKKKGHTPITRVKNPEPNNESPDWVIWAAWADRITFEEIEKKTGYSESEVIKIMRRSLKLSSFKLCCSIFYFNNNLCSFRFFIFDWLRFTCTKTYYLDKNKSKNN